MAEVWSKNEVVNIIEHYFMMLRAELAHQPYNKTENRENLLSMLSRSKGSIEFKHANISAVLISMGLPFIRGYKPRSNYQQLLEDQVAKYLLEHKGIMESRFESFSNEVVELRSLKIDLDNLIGEEPEPTVFTDREPSFRPIKINYLEREQQNQKLGEAGESLVISFEQNRLRKAGKDNLADRVEWISKDKGDGTGFDILSKNLNGSDRYVEVKTTKLTKQTPFYLTKNELSFSKLKENDFYLYRIYNFDSAPRLYIKQGAYDKYSTLIPMNYKAIF